MHQFVEISPYHWQCNPFVEIGENWLTVNTPGEIENSMTASWGSMGIAWNLPVFTLLIRRERHSWKLIQNQNNLTICGWEREKYGKVLSYLGTVSGKHEDKMKGSNLTVRHDGKAIFFDECRWFIDGTVIFAQPMNETCFRAPFFDKFIPEFYSKEWMHYLVYAKVERLLVRQ